MFNNPGLSKLGYYSRSIVVKALYDIYSFGKVRYYLLNILFLYLEEKVLLICRILYISFDIAYYDFEVPLLFPLFKESLVYSIAFLKLIR
jgi:hypothetical protein